MAFYGCDFTFNGITASHMGLMLYSFGEAGQEDADFSVGEIIEDRIARRYDSLLYGLKQNEPLTFTMTFGADPDLIEAGSFLKRSKINEIVSWLTGYDSWGTLYIHQAGDTALRLTTPVSGGGSLTHWEPIYYYKCMITGLKLLTDGDYPWAFTCTVTCDSPYAYMRPQDYGPVALSGADASLTIGNTSALHGYYYPRITVTGCHSAELVIINETDDGHGIRLENIPTEMQNISIDCLNQTICSSAGYNLYDGFNFQFLRLKPGDNTITATGSGTLTITCEYPVQIGA